MNPQSAQKEHEWLAQLVGEWNADCTFHQGPGKPDCVTQSKEVSRKFGDLWVHSEVTGINGNPFRSMMQLGFDIHKSHWSATFISADQSHMWVFSEGTLEGNKLTIRTHQPSWTNPSKMALFSDEFEIIDPDHKVMRSFSLEDAEHPVCFMTIDFKRVKQ